MATPPASIQVDIAHALARIRRFLGTLYRFLKLLFQQVSTVLLSFNRLLKERLATQILVFHCARSFLKIIERLGTHRGRVRDDSLGSRINFYQGTATWTANVERFWSLRHTQILLQFDGRGLWNAAQLKIKDLM